MINKEKEENIDDETTDRKPVDVVELDIQSHLLIKDIDTNEILVNKRG